MPVQSAIKTFLQRWPESIPRRGIVVNTLNDASPFKSFMLSEEMVVFERSAPDALGARYVMLEYATISSIKLIDPTNAAALNQFGFEGKLAGH